MLGEMKNNLENKKGVSQISKRGTMLSEAVQRRREYETSSPFYALPTRKTSAEIIREARHALTFGDQPIGVTRVGVRTVQTKRPFTPRETQRTLFDRNRGLQDERPPSSFTLSPLQFDSTDSTNKSAAQTIRGRLLPLLTVSASDVQTFTGDSLQGSRRLHRHQFRNALSLCDLPEESEENDSHTQKKLNGPPTRSYTITSLSSESDVSGILLSQSYQKLAQENDLQVRDLDSARTTKVLLSPVRTPATIKPSTPEAPYVAMSQDDMTAIKTSNVSPRKGSATDHRKIISKRKGVERSWSHVTEVTEPRLLSNSLCTPKPQEPAVDQSMYFEEKVGPILDEISRAISCGVDDGVQAELVDKLYNVLEAGGLLGRHFRYRSNVLKVVFRLVDREHGKLLGNVARVMLALKVSGNNLTSVCKLIFKVTRHDANDFLFMDGNLLELLLDAVACAVPVDQPEACIYGYGALKFLTMNSQLVTRLLHRGILELLVIHMKIIINHKEEHSSIPEQTTYALVQLTATLRHVSSCERAFSLLLKTGAVTQVCKLLDKFCDDPDVTSNVVRILSIISTQVECCTAAASVPETLPAAVNALKIHANVPAIVVRLAYALGNMLANSDEARWQVFNVNGFSETMFELLSKYLQKDRAEQAASLVDTLGPSSGTSEDVLVKLTRVLANISVHSGVGSVLACSKTCLEILVSIISHKTLEESEELVLSSLATLNNLTFYTRTQTPTALHIELAECLCETLSMDNLEGLVEAIRVFGNLTHSKEVRDILARKEILEVLVEMLDCDSQDLVFVCAGVLVNMMSDAAHRETFQHENGVLRMNDVLQYFGYGDWQLCSLCCQVLWNFSASVTDIKEILGEKEASRLSCILEEFLDDDSYFNNPEVLGNVDPSMREVAYQLWEEFAAVATKLLDRLDEAGVGEIAPE